MAALSTDRLIAQPQSEPTEAVAFPPGDLYSDEPPLETHLHLQQLLLLLKCIDWLWQDRHDYFATGNLTIYYSPHQRKSEDFREKHSEPFSVSVQEEAVQSIFGPDFFVVLGTEKRPRKSWVVWEEEGKYPHVIVELLSDSTTKTDRGLKKQIYQDTFRTPDYFWFDPDSQEFQGFHLVDGAYQALKPNDQGWLWSQQMQLWLGVRDRQLRFFTPEGDLVPTPEEAATTAAQSLATEQQRVSQLAAKLQELGINPDEI